MFVYQRVTFHSWENPRFCRWNPWISQLPLWVRAASQRPRSPWSRPIPWKTSPSADSDAKKNESGDLPNIQSFVNHVVPIFSNIQIFLVMTKKQKKWTCVIVKPLRPLSVIKKTIFAGLRRLLAFLERFHSWKKILWAPQLGTIPHAILDAVAHQWGVHSVRWCDLLAPGQWMNCPLVVQQFSMENGLFIDALRAKNGDVP